LGITLGFDRSAPMSVPRTPATFATIRGAPEGRIYASTAAIIGGMKAGVTMPTPFTGLAITRVTMATTATPTKLYNTAEGAFHSK
jgi:hypothetical protein